MKKYLFLLPVFLSLVYFFAEKKVVPLYTYIIFSAPVALYFFPVRLFLVSTTGLVQSSKFLFFASSLLFFLITTGSILGLALGSNEAFSIIFLIISLLNFLASLYYAGYHTWSEESLIHIGFIAITTVVFIT